MKSQVTSTMKQPGAPTEEAPQASVDPVPASERRTPEVIATAPAEKPASKRSWRKTAALILVPLALAGGLYYGYQWWTIGRFQISTDDAYVHADNATLSSKVSGYRDLCRCDG